MASLRTARSTLIMVSMCFAGGPGGRWSRSPASSMRTSGDPMPTARLMPSRSSFTERSNSLSSLGSTAPPPVPSHRPARAAASLTSFQCAGSLVPGSIESCRKIASSFNELAYSINCRSFQRSARIE